MQVDAFNLKVFSPGKAEVYIAWQPGGIAPQSIVTRLDQASIRVITDLADETPRPARADRMLAHCSALVIVLTRQASETISELVEIARLGAALNLPMALLCEPDATVIVDETAEDLRLQFGAAPAILARRNRVYGPIAYSEQNGIARQASPLFDEFVAAVLEEEIPTAPYAFFIGRLEEDFAHARDAIRAAVESEAGIPCLWSDDGRHRIDVDSVCERTRLLIDPD